MAAFTITFTTIYDIPVNGIIILTYPSQVQPYDSTVTTVTCSLNIAYAATWAHNSATRTITISNIVTVIPIVGGTSIQITLNEMKNPSTSTASDSFTISTYQVSSGTNYIIDSISTGLTVKSNWNYPCKTWNSATPSTCASCLTDSSGNQLLLQTSTVSGSSVTTWVSACNTDYANVNGVCQPCLANCGAWLSTNLSSCTKWGKSAALFLAGTRCTNTCPDGTYGNTSNNNWDSCVYPWETWTSATSCLTWAKLDSSGNTSTLIKLQGTQCLASWTANTYVDVSNVWTACSTNWKYWSQSTTICTAWNSPSVLDNTDKTWKSSCPSGTTIYNSSTGAWDLCNTNWATCTGSINTCATCAFGLVITTSNTCSTSCLTTAEYINSSNRWVNWATGWKSWSTTSTYCDKWITNYLFSNFTCVTSCPSGFTIDSTDKTRWVLAGLQWAFGYKIDASGTACEPSSVVWNSGYTLNSEKTKCIPEPGPIAPFPFLIAYAIFIVVVLIGYIKNRTEMITTWLIKGIAILEIPYYIIQIYSAAYISSWGIMIGTIIALIILIVWNIVFYIVYLLYVVKDHAFKHWKDKYKCTSRTISITSLIVNFKLFRSFYSKFYGLNTFHAPFEKSTIFYRPFVIMNIIYMLLCLTPIIIVDIVAFYFIQWGYQLLIVAIESFIFSIALIILSLIEFFRIKKRFFSDEDDSYLAINPKMFDNAYTVAGGIPRDSHPKTTINKQRGVPKFEDSQNVFLNNSYSYNKDMKYNDATNLSSIGIISKLYGGKGTMDNESKARNLNLHTIINKMHGDSTLIARSAINVMDLKDNQIFKKRRDYDKNTRLDDEDNFDRFDRKYLRRWESFEDFREIDATFAPDKKELLNEKCISFPPSPRSMEKLDRYMYLDEADFRDKMKAEFSYNNLYADKSRSGYG